MFDGEAFGQQMVEIIRGYVGAELAPLIERNAALEARIADLEARELLLPEKGDPGEVDMDAVKALIAEAVSTLPPAEKGEPGRDGIGLADVLRDVEGSLVVVMTDGRTKSLGKIDGKDGGPGRDGLGFDDLNVEQIGERTVRFLLRRDADEAEFDVTFPVPIYRGVFKEGEAYERGDLTTWAGSLWHLNEAKGLKPGAPDSGWQLAAKAGRPGKDAGK